MFTFGAVLIIGVLFFSFSKADAAAEQADQVGVELPEYTETFTAAGDNVELNGYFKNDVIVVGSTITINGYVDGDVIAAGGNITINAPVQGDVRLAGGNITLTSVVERNATLFGGRILIEPTATIQRDVFVQAGELTLQGDVLGTVHGNAGTVIINGVIGSDVYFKSVNNLRLQSDAQINGDLYYSSSEQAVIDEQAVVHGEELYSPPLVEPKEKTSRFTVWFFARKIIALVGLLLVGGVVLMLFRKRTPLVVKNMLEQVGRSFVWGLIYLATVPLLLALLVISLIGIPLGILGFALFGTSLYITKIYVGTALGKLLLPNTKSLVPVMILGVCLYYVVITILGNLPFPYSIIGTVVTMACIVWAAGGVVLHIRDKHYKTSR